MSRKRIRSHPILAITAAVCALALGMPMSAAAAPPHNGDPCSPFWTQATPSGPAFSFSPPAPLTQVSVALDASASQPGTANKWTLVSGDAACEETSVETDPISSYKWDFGDGSPTQASAAPTASHTYPHSGTFSVTLTVTEANCQGGPNAHCFTNSIAHDVTIGDRLPVASFTEPAEVSAGQPANFDASASSDADGTIVNYHWDFGDGRTQDTATPTTSHVYGGDGPKTVSLTLTDDSGGTGQVQHFLSVVNLPPTAAFTAPDEATPGQVASFDASASSDSDGNIVSYHWDFGDGQSQTTTTPTTAHTYGSAGSRLVTLTVTDNAGGTGQAQHTVAVVAPPGRCVVPRLIGKNPAGARKLLGRQGCRLGKVRHKRAHGHKRGRIVRQAPKPGTIRPAGSAVGVTVAR